LLADVRRSTSRGAGSSLLLGEMTSSERVQSSLSSSSSSSSSLSFWKLVSRPNFIKGRHHCVFFDKDLIQSHHRRFESSGLSITVSTNRSSPAARSETNGCLRGHVGCYRCGLQRRDGLLQMSAPIAATAVADWRSGEVIIRLFVRLVTGRLE